MDDLERHSDGSYIVEKSMIVVCDDYDILYIIGNGKSDYAVVVFCTSPDSQYFLTFDLPATAYTYTKTVDIPVGSVLRINSLSRAIIRKYKNTFEVTLPNEDFGLE